jgi:hypothetical protein
MLDANNQPITGGADSLLKLGSKVRFRCNASGNTNIQYYYEFRIWATNTNYWTDLTDHSGSVANNVSSTYTIANSGKHIAQGRICTVGCYTGMVCPADAMPHCQDWEAVAGAPEFHYCQTDADCPSGHRCYQPPMPLCRAGANGEDIGCVQVMPQAYCQVIDGTNDKCQTDADCPKGQYCDRVDSYLLEGDNSGNPRVVTGGFCTQK